MRSKVKNNHRERRSQQSNGNELIYIATPIYEEICDLGPINIKARYASIESNALKCRIDAVPRKSYLLVFYIYQLVEPFPILNSFKELKGREIASVKVQLKFELFRL